MPGNEILGGKSYPSGFIDFIDVYEGVNTIEQLIRGVYDRKIKGEEDLKEFRESQCKV